MYNSYLMQMRTTASAVILKIPVHNVQRINNALANVNMDHSNMDARMIVV